MTKAVLIVIPAFDEAPTIREVVLNCTKYGDVLVINDGSKDQTGPVALSAGATLVSNEKNLGYEASLNVGYMYALSNGYEMMLTMDADGQLPESSVPLFIDSLQSGAALVVGKRKIISRVTENLLAKLAYFVSGIYDPYCGMKAYNLTVNRQQYFSKYNSIGTALAIDYLALGLLATNIEIEINVRVGQSKFGGSIASELRLTPSFFVGVVRLILIWLSRLFSK
jgi:glycosyltransferase involved in cell wall biosynthesis